MSKEDDWLVFKYILLFLIITFGVSCIVLYSTEYFKHNNDPVFRSKKKHNKQLEILRKNTEKFLKENRSVLVFTNDPEDINLYVIPNIDIHNNHYGFVNTHGEEFEKFNKNKNSLGYIVLLENEKNKYSKVQNLASIDNDSLEFTILSKHKYTAKEVEYINNFIDKNGTSIIHPAKVDTTLFNYERTIVTAQELHEEKIRGLKRMFAPRIDVSKDYLFYIFCYNKNIKNKVNFKRKAYKVKQIFFRNPSCKNCKVREISLQEEI